MKIIDPGHTYDLDHLDGEGPSRLTFVKRVGAAYPGNSEPAHGGVTAQEVLRALIARVEYTAAQTRELLPSDLEAHETYNSLALYHLRQALLELELRAALAQGEEEHFRASVSAADWDRIEQLPACVTCGYIACERHS